MPLWDKLRTELDRAGKAAQGALDEGKTRLEAFRARQLADKAAQALGYAVFRAKQSGQEVDWDALTRLVTALAEREADVKRLEDELRQEAAAAGTGGSAGSPETPGPAETTGGTAGGATTP